MGGIVTRVVKEKQTEWQEAKTVRKNTTDNVATLAHLALQAAQARDVAGRLSPTRVQVNEQAIQRFYIENEPSVIMYLDACTCGLPSCECVHEEPSTAPRRVAELGRDGEAPLMPILRPHSLGSPHSCRVLAEGALPSPSFRPPAYSSPCSPGGFNSSSTGPTIISQQLAPSHERPAFRRQGTGWGNDMSRDAVHATLKQCNQCGPDASNACATDTAKMHVNGDKGNVFGREKPAEGKSADAALGGGQIGCGEETQSAEHGHIGSRNSGAIQVL